MPSIPTLQTISNNLNTEVGYFFKEHDEEMYIVTYPGARRIVVSKSGTHDKIAYKLELLAEGMKNPFMEPAIVTHVGKEKEVEARVHDGQEFMYVLEGRIKLTLGSRDFILEKGNAAYWNGSVPHKGIGLDKKPAKALHVHLIPGRWTGTFQYSDLPARRYKPKGKRDKGNQAERR
jgi:mannose-6-phosphate isomerase-like protein (cupin superfamily)